MSSRDLFDWAECERAPRPVLRTMPGINPLARPHEIVESIVGRDTVQMASDTLLRRHAAERLKYQSMHVAHVLLLTAAQAHLQVAGRLDLRAQNDRPQSLNHVAGLCVGPSNHRTDVAARRGFVTREGGNLAPLLHAVGVYNMCQPVCQTSRLPAFRGGRLRNRAESCGKTPYVNQAAFVGVSHENGLYLVVAGAGFEPATFGL
jgi:hypothetical protein